MLLLFKNRKFSLGKYTYLHAVGKIRYLRLSRAFKFFYIYSHFSLMHDKLSHCTSG
jgi:hypothetical protein